jgi:hypothetical protein
MHRVHGHVGHRDRLAELRRVEHAVVGVGRQLVPQRVGAGGRLGELLARGRVLRVELARRVQDGAAHGLAVGRELLQQPQRFPDLEDRDVDVGTVFELEEVECGLARVVPAVRIELVEEQRDQVEVPALAGAAASGAAAASASAPRRSHASRGSGVADLLRRVVLKGAPPRAAGLHGPLPVAITSTSDLGAGPEDVAPQLGRGFCARARGGVAPSAASSAVPR